MKPDPKNAFEALCELASMERWCWRMDCPTCGHAYFRLGFREILRGNHPDQATWTVSGYCLHGLMEFDMDQLPKIGGWPIPHQSYLSRILARASLQWIARNVRHPEWVGFLCLGLLYCEDTEREDRKLTRAWVPQLLEMLPAEAAGRQALEAMMHEDAQGVLLWQMLRELEDDLTGASLSEGPSDRQEVMHLQAE